MNRRGVLKLAGVAGLGVLAAGFGISRALPVIPARPAPDPETARGWITHSDGAFSLWLPRVEMGQNVATAMKQIACEELGAGWDAVTVRHQDTARMAPVRATVGSESIMEFGPPLARACAALRDAIAAGKSEGEIDVPDLPLADLRAFRPGGRIVGRDMPLDGAQGIVTGAPTYASDIRRPGMVFGRVLYPPTLPELDAPLRRVDRSAAEQVPGFVALVQDPLLKLGRNTGIGIVAETPGALDRIAEALAPEWDRPLPLTQQDIDARLDLPAPGEAERNTVQASGDTPSGPFDVDLRFDIPAASHAPIEPQTAVAEYSEAGQMTLWVGHQDVFYIRDKMVGDLGLAEDKVTVLAQRVGGGFGGKTLCTAEMEAAVLAMRLRRPVKVQWTRAQVLAQAHNRPPSRHHIRVRLDGGRLADWSHRFRSGHVLFTNAALPPWMQGATDIFVGDPGVARGSALPYAAPNVSVSYGLDRLPLFAGPWRGLGAGPNLLALESAMDEAAHAAGADPLDFRLAHLEPGRLRRVLEAARDLAGWQGSAARSNDGVRQARGVACGIYKDMSFAAVIADVSVAPDGTSRVSHMYCAHDCGRVINPDQVRAQCEGNMIWGLGSVLMEGLQVRAAAIAAQDFAGSPIPTMADAPALSVRIVDHGDPPSGAGETAIVGAMAAIANAVRAATGIRPGRFPLDPAGFAA